MEKSNFSWFYRRSHSFSLPTACDCRWESEHGWTGTFGASPSASPHSYRNWLACSSEPGSTYPRSKNSLGDLSKSTKHPCPPQQDYKGKKLAPWKAYFVSGLSSFAVSVCSLMMKEFCGARLGGTIEQSLLKQLSRCVWTSVAAPWYPPVYGKVLLNALPSALPEILSNLWF